jgi:hypothetical protein
VTHDDPLMPLGLWPLMKKNAPEIHLPGLDGFENCHQLSETRHFTQSGMIEIE